MKRNDLPHSLSPTPKRRKIYDSLKNDSLGDLVVIPIKRWGHAETEESVSNFITSTKPLQYTKGDGYKLIRGYILLDSDDPHKFFESLPKGVLDQLAKENSLTYDKSTNIAHLTAKLRPNNMVNN